MSKETNLAGLNKNIRIESFVVYARIGLRENREKNSMNGISYFEFSEDQFSQSECLLKVSVEVEGYSPENKGGNLACLSSNPNCTYKSENMVRLSLSFNDAPIKSQTYEFSLHSNDETLSGKCEATKKLVHKIKYRRSSWWERAMSV